MRAAIYLRKSTAKQSEASLDDQLRLCRALGERNGWQIMRVYEDDAVSGAIKGRKGYQAMLSDAIAGRFDLVVAESMDRFNRDLEETARLYKQLGFVGVGIHTVSEGPISEVHVSINGLMGELYLKALGEKTRRGLEGRVLSGKSGGGKCYGYDVASGVGDGGDMARGERKINVQQAEVVREIFRRFAAGEGPRAIARALNDRRVPGPYGRPWGDTTIRGHAKKGTGLLNNELYRGKLIWGRQRFVKDPSTGKRVSRLNPAGSETASDVPHLRIVDDGLWAAIKERQEKVARPLTDPHLTTPLNETHRPRFLLSGLLTCGICGGGFTITAKDRYGCARRSRQGTCTNCCGIKRQELERRVLEGLQSRLVTPNLMAAFIKEYTAEWNRLQKDRRANAIEHDRKVSDVKRRIAAILDAMERGIVTPTTKERLEALEAEKSELDSAPTELSPKVAIHPNLAERYRQSVLRLQENLADPELGAAARSTLRALIKTIKVFPGAKRGEVGLEIHGELAAILDFARGAKTNSGSVSRIQVSVVAGACNRLDLQLERLLSAIL
jgi:site-specific DNA recombinase